MSAIWVLVGLLIGSTLKTIKKWVPVVYKKWIKGECRHFCFKCEHYSVCRYELGIDTEYIQGFNDGYEVGHNDYINKI